MSTRKGASGLTFARNWDGAWIGTREGLRERIIAWPAAGGGWMAYRRVVLHPMLDDQQDWTAVGKQFDTFAEVLAGWEQCPDSGWKRPGGEGPAWETFIAHRKMLAA